MVEVGARAIGARVLRVEDPRILTGRGRYIDDITLPGMLHAAFKRSTVPARAVAVGRRVGGAGAARCRGRLHRARTSPGSPTPRHPAPRSACTSCPGSTTPAVYALATDKVRYVGDPIALVVADDRYIAEDALELIEEDIDWLDPVVSYDDALDPTRSRRCSTSSTTTSPSGAR